MTRDSLGDRMKRYEHASRATLPPRMPIVVRVDGKAFHTYTRGLAQPFDGGLIDAMDAVAVRLCEEIQGAQVAYVQSDEVSVLVHGYKRHASMPWFDGEVQKMASVSAAVAAATMTATSPMMFGCVRPALFDSRVFVLPEADVCNYFGWRQQDAIRNSVQMLARSMFSHRECHQKDARALKAMCEGRGHPWRELPVYLQRGRCAVRETYTLPDGTLRSRWTVDREPPVFLEERAYIERHLATEDERCA